MLQFNPKFFFVTYFQAVFCSEKLSIGFSDFFRYLHELIVIKEVALFSNVSLGQNKCNELLQQV